MSRILTAIEIDDSPEPEHNCEEWQLKRVDHPLNSVDQEGASQSYQVYQCKVCYDYWGCRHQYHAGTGVDDRWHRFGWEIPPDAVRHY